MAETRRWGRRGRTALAGLVLGVACAAGARAPQESLEQRIVEIADRVRPSVVHIEAIVKFDDRRNQVTGSGLVVSADGTILTNEHVVDNAEKVTVSVPGWKRRFPARIIGTDRQTDVALLRITPDAPLVAADFGSSEDLRVGQWVLAIGNPYGLDGTVSFGIVSAKGRNLGDSDLLNDFIQTDAMIDRGSSGGPLVDLEGRVVGLNSRGQGRGIGFTIPIETVREVMRQLENGGIERGFLGITIQPLDRELADYFGIRETTGVVVNSVVRGSPAERGGLQPGDVITHVDGAPIEAETEEDLGDFQRRVAGVDPGREIEVALRRGAETLSTRLAVGAQPKLDASELETDWGFHVQEITANLAREQRLLSDDGVFVVFVGRGSPAREAGLQVGDVIVRVEKAPTPSLDAFRAAIEPLGGNDRFLLTAVRGDETKFLLVKPGARFADAPADPDSGGVDLED